MGWYQLKMRDREVHRFITGGRVEDLVEQRAEEIADWCNRYKLHSDDPPQLYSVGDQYETDRSRRNVYTTNIHAMNHNLKYNTLNIALGKFSDG